MRWTELAIAALFGAAVKGSVLDTVEEVLNDAFSLDTPDMPASVAPNVLKTLKELETEMGVPSDGARDSIESVLRAGLGDELVKALQARVDAQTCTPRANILEVDDPFDVHVTDYARFGSAKLRFKDAKDAGVGDTKTFSGYLDTVDDHHLFFWFFEARNNPTEAPTVLWLNGGPGCSSLMGLFFEFGPSRLTARLKPVSNKWAWNTNANIIFVDSPVNVGFSYSDSAEVSDTVNTAKDLYELLELFFGHFPEYAKAGVHIAAESYGGHYAPGVGSEILVRGPQNFELASVMVGNGLTDPLTQYQHYTDMACGLGGWPAALEDGDCDKMKAAEPECQVLIGRCYDELSAWACTPAQVYCNNELWGPYFYSGHNFYDIRMVCGDEGCYEDEGYFIEYLNLPKVRKALGIEHVPVYENCNGTVNENFLYAGDWMQPYHHNVTLLLNNDVPVLIFAGDADFSVNWLGNEAWTKALDWEHHTEFADAPLIPWISPSVGSEMGQVRNFGHFTFLRLYAAGHMVPHDQPESSYDMFNAWISGNYSLV